MLRVNIDIHESISEWLNPTDFYSFRTVLPTLAQQSYWAATPVADIADAAIVARAPRVIRWAYTAYPDVTVSPELYQDILRADYVELVVLLYQNAEHTNYDVIRFASPRAKEALVCAKHWNTSNFERFAFAHPTLNARDLARHCQLSGCALDVYVAHILDFPLDLIGYFIPNISLIGLWIGEYAYAKLAKTYDYYPQHLLQILNSLGAVWYIKHIRPLVAAPAKFDSDCRALYRELWRVPDTLQILDSLKNLQLLGYKNGELRDYLPAASASVYYHFVDYLIACGMPVHKTDFLNAKSSDAASALYSAWVIQYLEPFMFIIILCLVITIFPKIEKKSVKYNAQTNRS